MRRLAYAFSIGALFTSITILSILGQIVLSVILCVYIITAMPFEDRRDNYIELMNELTILAFFYLCLGLVTDDYLLGGQMRIDYGHAMTILLLINLIANAFMFIYGAFLELRVQYRRHAPKLCQKLKQILNKC